MFQLMTDFKRRVCPAALALPFLLLFAAPAAVAQTESKPASTPPAAVAPTLGGAAEHLAEMKRRELQQRVTDIVEMFKSDPRFNRGKTPEQIKDGVEFVTGNVLFVLGHETAHALISVFEIPVIGREEDAADALSTVLALKMANSFADRVVTNAARGWFLADQRDRKEGTANVFYDEHGMDLQRAYYIVCLMVGGSPEKFTELANEVKLPKERQDTCKFDYSNASWSWEEVLKPHMRKKDAPKTKIEVSYAPTTEYASLAALGQKLQILETVSEWLSEDFAWTKPITMEMQECGSSGARWLPIQKKIVVCYELIREFVQLHRSFGQAELVPGTMTMSKNKKVVLTAVAAKPSNVKRASNRKSFKPERKRR